MNGDKARARWRTLGVSLALIATAIGGFTAGRSSAAIPTTSTLTYSGSLMGPTGLPIEDAEMTVQVRLWNQADGGTELCRSEPVVGVQLGRFSVPLPAACTTVVQQNPDLFVEVIVDGTPLGRAKAGAVPYAVETHHSTSADVAASASIAEAAGGALQATLDDHEARLAALESRVDLHVFGKGGDNGTQSCNQWCARAADGVELTGTCVGAQWQTGPFSGQFETCDATLTSTGQVDPANLACWCARP